MGTIRYEVAGDAEGRPTTRACGHLDQVRDVTPSTTEGCEDCLREHTRWVHLRECMACGHVACCDSSPMRHASAHSREHGHAIARSIEPGEEWAWCYADDLLLEPAGVGDGP
jgi:hypothetical protein